MLSFTRESKPRCSTTPISLIRRIRKRTIIWQLLHNVQKKSENFMSREWKSCIFIWMAGHSRDMTTSILITCRRVKRPVAGKIWKNWQIPCTNVVICLVSMISTEIFIKLLQVLMKIMPADYRMEVFRSTRDGREVHSRICVQHRHRIMWSAILPRSKNTESGWMVLIWMYSPVTKEMNVTIRNIAWHVENVMNSEEDALSICSPRVSCQVRKK